MKPLIAALCLAFALPAHAQTLACDDRDKVLDHLESKYDERVTDRAMLSDGIVEVLQSPDGETWTIVATNARGVTCLMAAGRAWESLPEPEPGSGT